ncbi:MAG: hypothetical protein A2474_00315 [Elusimicrobia bacterium RIFOXYC2_FULL_34_12]|nr:MAG: hypothetical protein A2474_00315 [Elusimicrobia bacterium RIFOXYC2_FULL_34_12]OGS37927.1 MAG: hypothetical protein A2551_00480 [Elusimicrobia bacterium RIFOXYD2_FULL_34_30]
MPVEVKVKVNERFGNLASDIIVEKTVSALKSNGINVYVVNNGEEAKKKVLEIIPKDSEVMNMTSTTLLTINLEQEINELGKFNSIRNKLNSMNQKTQGQDMKRLGAAPEWVIGSVHAVTQDGHLFIASQTGSQLPAYAYGAKNVIWVIGTQKIVENFDKAFKRLYEYCFPLEDQRALKVYGTHSGVNKILIVNKEVASERITVIFVKENIGF